MVATAFEFRVPDKSGNRTSAHIRGFVPMELGTKINCFWRVGDWFNPLLIRRELQEAI
jgi:hypothetical protein